jgi:UDP-N-acetylmuramate dehydrogenase
MIIQENISLKAYNSLNVEAQAEKLITINHDDELSTLLKSHAIDAQQLHILGSGSNTLLTKDVAGLVIYNQLKGITISAETDDYVDITAASGELWHDLVNFSIKHGYYGIENLSLIPGTVGAAPIQNIGAYGVELKDVFLQLQAVNLTNGSTVIFDHSDCEFAYRQSLFKTLKYNPFYIIRITIRLQKKPLYHLHYHSLKSYLETHNITPSLPAIADAVISIRNSKLPDPKKWPNAGSFFKNPLISLSHYQQLQQTHPNVPAFTQDNNPVKLSAAWLIEQCGFKGKRLDTIGMSAQQALVLINYDHASGEAINAFADTVKNTVEQRFNITLEREVNLNFTPHQTD